MNQGKIKIMVRSLLISYILTAVFLVLLTLCLYYFQLKSGQVAMAVNGIYAAVCLLGGLFAGKSIRQRRFFWGLLAGSLYFLVLLLMSWVINRQLSSEIPRLVTTFLLCAGGGTIGGMLS